MQVWVSVNEADIGHIHAGQPVTFTVDAFPGETFRGEVHKVRLNAADDAERRHVHRRGDDRQLRAASCCRT